MAESLQYTIPMAVWAKRATSRAHALIVVEIRDSVKKRSTRTADAGISRILSARCGRFLFGFPSLDQNFYTRYARHSAELLHRPASSLLEPTWTGSTPYAWSSAPAGEFVMGLESSPPPSLRSGDAD